MGPGHLGGGVRQLGRDPLIPQLRAVLEQQYERKLQVERETGHMVLALFYHDDGRPLRYIRRPWTKACLTAGLETVKKDVRGEPMMDKNGKPVKVHTHIFHDFRRTAARNLVRAGVPTALAKKFTGHETDSVFQRYAIADETSLREAGEKYAALLGGQTAEREVVPLTTSQAKTGQRQRVGQK